MASQTINKEFRVSSYNMHGLNQGCDMLKYLCNDLHCDVIFLQEHWQTPVNMNKILAFSDDYIGFGISAMEERVKSVFHGRPYGGTSILVSSAYTKYIKHIVCRERFVIILINSIAFVNIYFPCKSNCSVVNLMETVDNMIDEIIVNLFTFAPKYIFLGGDLNVDLRVVSDVSKAIQKLVDSLDIINCYNITTPSVEYTFHSISMGHRTLIDWLFVSRALETSVVDFDIIDREPNLSDHLPVVLNCTLSDSILNVNNDTDNNNNDCTTNVSTNLCWSKADLDGYYHITGDSLQSTFVEFSDLYKKLFNEFAITSANIIGSSVRSTSISNYSIVRNIAVFLIDKYYNELVQNLVAAAELSVPRISGAARSAAKHWWSDELDDLKARSIDAHAIWKDAGRPRSGPVFDIYKGEKIFL